MFERPKNGESAILVSLNIDDIDHKENTSEFKLLASSAGFKVAELVESQRKFPDAKFFIGSGKLKELLQIKTAENIKTIIFNHELTPSQERNIEKATSMRVYDRTALILFIFAMRAKRCLLYKSAAADEIICVAIGGLSNTKKTNEY